MNTRRKGSLTPSYIEGRDRVKRNAATNTENFQEQTDELGQAPVFNIHIHLPANNDTNLSKMYLPRIQPVIHVHFDELADELRNSASQQGGGLSEKYLRTLVKRITPKFGNILFHHKKNSFNGHSNSNEINNLKPNQTLRKKNSNIELESRRIDTRQKQNSENSKSAKNGLNKRTREIRGEKLSKVVYNGQPVKLKKAIVVLEDIFQPSLCRSGKVRNLLQENTVSQYSPSPPLNGATNLGPQIKIEPEEISSPVNENEKLHVNSDNCINSFSGTNSFCSVGFESPKEKVPLKRESFDSLLEGCNFSDILKKFREKHRKLADECSETPKVLPEAQTLLENNNFGSMQNYVQTQKEEFWAGQSHNVDVKQEEEEDSRGWENFQNGIVSQEIENQPSENSYERNTETGEQSNCADPSVEESRNEVDQMHGDIGMESLINPFHVNEVESDVNETTTRNKLSSDVVGDLEPVDSSNPTSNTIIKSEFSPVETNELILPEAGDQYFDLTLMKKEVVSPKEGTHKMADNENGNSEDGENGSSPKKFKQSSETTEEPPTKAAKGMDYISLNISGPTEFTVAPLSNVQGYKAHAAQNFKKDMLFGKRINRFTNPEHLQMYKLKKQQKNCQNKKTLKK